jgi:hypothetical protein
MLIQYNFMLKCERVETLKVELRKAKTEALALIDE